MKKCLLLSLSALVALGSCHKNVDDPFWERSRELHSVFQHNMKIDSVTYSDRTFYAVADSGDQDVFLYSNSWGGNDQISDNEYSANIWFAIAPELTSFTYTDAQLAEHRCFYTGSGAWGGYGFEALDKGTISGTKNTDGSWDVSIDIQLDTTDYYINKSRITTTKTFQEGAYY